MESVTESAIRALLTERDELKQHCLRLQGLVDHLAYPPGHFYSAIVDPTDKFVIRATNGRLSADAAGGLNVNCQAMLNMLRKLAVHYSEFMSERKSQSRRYEPDNPFFGAHDASIYFSFLLESRPKTVIEVGCGFSTRLLFDTNESFFGNKVQITLIDPILDKSPELNSSPQATVLSCKLQDVPLSCFEQLQEGDILFIDSSHVCKTGSDVNHYLFHIFPRLQEGVLIHIHDIFYPFEYPRSWVLTEKRSWNEAYALRAFLQYNPSFQLLYWNNFVFHFLNEELASLFPSCLVNEGGSLWIRKAAT